MGGMTDEKRTVTPTEMAKLGRWLNSGKPEDLLNYARFLEKKGYDVSHLVQGRRADILMSRTPPHGRIAQPGKTGARTRLAPLKEFLSDLRGRKEIWDEDPHAVLDYSDRTDLRSIEKTDRPQEAENYRYAGRKPGPYPSIQAEYANVPLGALGNAIRGFAGNDFAVRLFENYWTGGGDYQFSDGEFSGVIADITDKDGRPHPRKTKPLDPKKYKPSVFYRNGNKYRLERYDIYGSAKYGGALGSVGFILDEDGRVRGILDQYDFNEKADGEREARDEWKTTAVRWASMFEPRAKAFTIRGGITPEQLP